MKRLQFLLIQFSFTILVNQANLTAQSKYNAQIFQPDALQTPSICMVMIDPDTEKNMIIWEKTPNYLLKRYQVWKITGLDYVMVAEKMEADTSVITDWDSKPKSKTDAYVLLSVDSCGNATQKSSWHKPFLLQSSLGLNDVINLSWQPYMVDGNEYIFKFIVIYRGTDSTLLEPIDTVVAGIGSNSYTDNYPPLDANIYYRIGGERETPCDPNNILGKKANKGPFVHSLSNLEDNRLQSTGFSVVSASGNLRVFPNPMSMESKITWNSSGNQPFSLSVYDLDGRLLKKVTNLNTTEYIISRGELKRGCYIIELKGSITLRERLLVN
jgi:hypothetical protein